MKCRIVLKRITLAGVEANQCSRCLGLWFRRRDINQYLRQYSRYQLNLRELFDAWRDIDDRPCPDCGINLKETRFDAKIALTVETCERCGGVFVKSREDLDHLKVVDEHVETVENQKTELSFLTSLTLSVFLMPVITYLRTNRPGWITFALAGFCGLVYLGQTDQMMADYSFHGDTGGLRFLTGLVTYQFLHSDIFHLLGNLYILIALGRNVEDLMSHGAYLGFYLCGGILGAIAYYLVQYQEPGIPMIGASGAISAVEGVFIYVFRQAKLTFPFNLRLSARDFGILTIALNLWAASIGGGGIAWAAHLGGLFWGLGVGWFFYPLFVQARPVVAQLNKSVS